MCRSSNESPRMFTDDDMRAISRKPVIDPLKEAPDESA